MHAPDSGYGLWLLAAINAESTVGTVAKYYPVDDLLTEPDQELTLTVGGGAATGTVKLKLHYEVVGNL